MSAIATTSVPTLQPIVPALDSLIVFPNGLVGQPDWKQFVLLSPEKDGAIQVLQSVEFSELALMVTNPQWLVPNYTVSLSREERSILQLNADEQPTLLCTISVHNNQITSNLVGPLVFNSRNHIGTQVVVADSAYTTRHPVAAIGTQE